MVSADYPGPWLEAAIFCEHVDEASAGHEGIVRGIRGLTTSQVVERLDRFPPDVEPVINLLLLLMFQRGAYHGVGLVTLEEIYPTGEHRFRDTQPVDFSVERPGYYLILHLPVAVRPLGVRRWNVLVNGLRLTQVALTLTEGDI